MKLFLATLLLVGATAFAQAPATKPAPSTKPAPAPVTAPKPQAIPTPTPTATGYVGNSKSKLLHKADCKAVASIKPTHKVVFASKAEADKAGYKPCKICKP